MLHAELYHLPKEKIGPRIEELLDRYDLKSVVNSRPDSLPLGMKQRLQLAVAVLHEPSILILDEPTSGVDPIARDAFWRTLIDLSRDDGVTIFVTTHFMNEADRCDRISLMHAGKVLAVGAPQELVKERGSASLEDCFVGYLAEAAGIDMSKKVEAPASAAAEVEAGERPKRFKIGRLWAYARRETVELLRDPIRLAFALVGPIILMFAFGYRHLLRYREPGDRVIRPGRNAPEPRPASGFRRLALFLGPAADHVGGRGRETAEKREHPDRRRSAARIRPRPSQQPHAGSRRDGRWRDDVPRRDGEELCDRRHQEAGRGIARSQRRAGSANAWTDDDIQTRFRYNQAFLSVNAMVPSIFMLLLCLIPAIMSAIAVVREKETGSIANFRSTPITRLEYLIGKQLPYIAVAMIAFFALLLIAIFIFHVPPKGPFLVLLLGTIVYVIATVGFGVLISSFTRTQVAAVFATAILSIVPAVNFSGMLAPVSSLSGGARIIGLSFPSSWYQQVSVGVFAKALGIVDLWRDIAAIALIALVFLVISLALLRKQEA